MATDNRMKDKMAQMTPRQKVIIVVMAIVVLIIIWQVMGLMGSGGTSAPAIQPVVAKMDASKPGVQTGQASPVEANKVANTQKPSSEMPQADDNLRQASIVNDSQFNRMQRMTEEKYVGKLNELEELRIQRQIAENNQAIAAAKLATVTAEKDISDLLTRPAPGASVFSTNNTVKTSVDINPLENPSAAGVPLPPPPEQVAPYKLISVSMLFNKWTAVVSLQDTMFSVGVGDVLPPDGSVVTSISKNSITLKKSGKSRRVSITASL